MGYLPQPLSFVCRRCSLITTCDDPRRFDSFLTHRKDGCPERADCADDCADDWEQLDVVFVHWSGGYDPSTWLDRAIHATREAAFPLNGLDHQAW